ncbi:MAG: tyrosine-type recombinase/integrase [Campylobacterales bacterium]|nr:tyrosine-type recombinase/integrase [Campylobacterales bacterium]
MMEHIEQFIFHCTYEKNLSDKTLKAYKIDLKQFVCFVGSKYGNTLGIADVDKHIVRGYIKSLFDLGYKAKTVKRKIATLKAIFTYMEAEEVIVVSPFRKMQLSIKEPLNLPKTIKLSDIKKLLIFMYQYKGMSKNKSSYGYMALVRDIAIIELLFATGMRVGEICSIKKKDIDINTGLIKVLGKGSKERTIHFCNNQARDTIREYARLFFDEIAQSKHFFINREKNHISEQSVRLMIKRYCSLAKIKTHITPHMFRHSMATLLLEEGVDIRYIQHMLGHASISTTQIYTKVNQKQQKKILSTKHPRRLFSAI